MNNWQLSIDATNTALNSQGSAMKEQEKYSDSLQARINRLDTAWNKFTLSMGKAFLTNGIIDAVESFNGLATGASKIVDKIGALSIVFGILGIATVGLNTKFRTFTTSLIFGTQGMTRAQLASAGLTAGMSRLEIATGGVKTALRTLGTATLVTAAFAILGIVIEKVINAVAKARQEEEAFQETQQKGIDALTTSKTETEQLIERYNGLTEAKKKAGQNWSVKQEEQYVALQNKLADIYPQLINYIDGAGNKHLKSKQQIDEEVKATEKLIAAKKEEMQISASKTIGDLITKRDNIGTKVDDKQKLIDSAKDGLKGKEMDIAIAKAKSDIVSLQNQWSNASQKINSEVLKIADSYNKLQIDSNIKQSVENFVQSLDFSKLNADQLEAYSKKIASVTDSLQSAYKSGDSEAFDKAKSSLMDYALKMGATEQQVYSLGLSFDDLKKAQENANSTVYAGKDGMDGLDESAGNLAGTVDGLSGSMDGLSNATDGATSSLSGNISAAEILFGVTSDEIQVLQNAIAVFQALSGQQNLSTQQSGLLAQATSVLAAQYPQLNGQIAENIGWISSQVGMMSSLSDVSGANAATMIANQNSTTKATIAQINQRILGYQKEAQALSALMSRIEASYDERGMSGARSYAYHNAEQRLGEINAELAKAQASKVEAYYSSGVGTGQVKPYNASSSGGGSKSSSGSGSSSKQDPIPPTQISEYDRRQRQLNMTLADSKARMDALSESSQAYRNELALQRGILSDQAKSMRDEIARLQQRNGVIQRQIAQWGDFNKMQRWQQEAYNNLTKEMEDNEKQVESLTSSQYDLQNQIRETTKAYQDSIDKQKEAIGQKADDFIQMYKDFYEKKKELDQKSLDDELSSYEKMVNEKLNLIDKQENANNYNKDLASKQKEIADLQSQINLFSMDSSQASKVADLRKQLADKQLEMSDFLHQHDVDQRKQALNDELEAKRSEIEEKKKLSEQYYDDILNDERKFAEMRNQIMQGNITDLQNMLGDFSKYLQDHMAEIGTSITQNLIDKIAQAGQGLKDAQSQVEEMGKVYNGSNGSMVFWGKNTDQKDQVYIIDDTPLLSKNSDGTFSPTGRIMPKGTKWSGYGIDTKHGVYNIGAGYITADPKYSRYQYFQSGGYTKNDEGLAYLHEKELVLNKADTFNFLKAIDITRSIANLLPKFQVPNMIQNPVQPQPISINMPITIENMNGTKEGVTDFFKQVNNKLRGKGGFSFNV